MQLFNKYVYRRYSIIMRPILILLLSLPSLLSAIIGSSFSLITRHFEYRFDIAAPNSSFHAFLKMAPASEKCAMEACFYGWVLNSTLGNRTRVFEGRKGDLRNPFFYLQFSNSTYSIIKNDELEPGEKLLLDLCAETISPLYTQLSNISPLSAHPNYQILPYLAQNTTIPEKLEVTTFLREAARAFSSKAYQLGWRESNQTDAFLYDSALNFTTARWIEPSPQVVIKVRLTNKYIFEQVVTYYNTTVQLAQRQKNIQTSPISSIHDRICQGAASFIALSQ